MVYYYTITYYLTKVHGTFEKSLLFFRQFQLAIMGDNLLTLMIAAAANIFVIFLLFVAAKVLKKYSDRLFNRQEQVKYT